MANMAGAIGAKAARIVGHWISVAVLAVVVFVRSAALSLTRRRPTWPRSAAGLPQVRQQLVDPAVQRNSPTSTIIASCRVARHHLI